MRKKRSSELKCRTQRAAARPHRRRGGGESLLGAGGSSGGGFSRAGGGEKVLNNPRQVLPAASSPPSIPLFFPEGGKQKAFPPHGGTGSPAVGGLSRAGIQSPSTTPAPQLAPRARVPTRVRACVCVCDAGAAVLIIPSVKSLSAPRASPRVGSKASNFTRALLSATSSTSLFLSSHLSLSLSPPTSCSSSGRRLAERHWERKKGAGRNSRPQ